MTNSSAFDRLFSLWKEIVDLRTASEVLGWDQETYMPTKGVEGRAGVLATLAGLRHAKLTSSELADTLAECSEGVAKGSSEAAHLRRARQQVNRAVKIPAELAKALAEARSAGLASWSNARKQDDFGAFRDSLANIVALKREEAAALAGGGSLYDALIDEYEPGAREAELAPLFDDLTTALAPLVRAVADSGKSIDEAPAQGQFPMTNQLEFGRMIAARMGFDFDAGRLDATTHPFCSGFHPGDVRITWRWQEDDFRPALFGIMHEAGHGLYEQGLPWDQYGTPAGEAVSLGVHESQSRLWENLVGRSRAFWQWALPEWHAAFPSQSKYGVDDLWPALHTVRPSFIRVEADEGTYNLHIAIRFAVERKLFSEGLAVDDLPELWDSQYEQFLGIRPQSAADGVLQDIHWAMGAFGYFPTYTLGNLINAQLFESASSAIGDWEAQFARGEFAPLLAWLRENVHVHGSRYEANELVERATGKPLTSDAFLRYITATTEEAYAITVAT